MAGKKLAELEEHHQRLQRDLELAHALSMAGLAKGGRMAFTALLAVLVSVGVGLTALLVTSKEFFSGWQIVAIVAILVAGFVIYYAFVFGRIAVIRAKLSQTEKQIEIEAGKNAE